MLYRISKDGGKSHITEVTRSTLAAEGLYEVKDLSQWLAATPRLLAYRLEESEAPQIIGCEVPISSEFRVDVLGVDTDATLVVCEVKRDESDPLYQGLQYCGRLFSMPPADLIALVEKHAKKDIAQLASLLELPEESALPEMWDLGRRAIRLVIVAQDYPLQIFQTARWLATTGVRISCIRFDCFKDGASQYLLPQQILPSVETAESYALQREAAHRQAQVRTRNMFYSLIANGVLMKDERVFLHDGKEIGIVRDDHIERISDKAKCLNCSQLTGISGSWSAAVLRDGKLKTVGDLRQSQSSSPAAQATAPQEPGAQEAAAQAPIPQSPATQAPAPKVSGSVPDEESPITAKET
jgi:hypothetical protein